MKRTIVIGAIFAALGVLAGNASAAPSENAACVGTFSSYFAHQGMRSELAREFAQNARPAGQNVYSHVAKEHGGLEECFAET
jgi:hypothetical protein